jgi:hypothetical protein
MMAHASRRPLSPARRARRRRLRLSLATLLLLAGCSAPPQIVWLPRETPLGEVVVLSGIPLRVCRGECAVALVGMESVKILEGDYFRCLLIYENQANHAHVFDPQCEWLMAVATPDTTFPPYSSLPPEVISETFNTSPYGDLVKASDRIETIGNGPRSRDPFGQTVYLSPLTTREIDRIIGRGTLPGLLDAGALKPGMSVGGVSYFEVPKTLRRGQRLHRRVIEPRQVDPLTCRVSLHLITLCDTLSATFDAYDLDSLRIARDALR